MLTVGMVIDTCWCSVFRIANITSFGGNVLSLLFAILWRISNDSSYFPFIISHLGDSGIILLINTYISCLKISILEYIKIMSRFSKLYIVSTVRHAYILKYKPQCCYLCKCRNSKGSLHPLPRLNKICYSWHCHITNWPWQGGKRSDIGSLFRRTQFKSCSYIKKC